MQPIQFSEIQCYLATGLFCSYGDSTYEWIIGAIDAGDSTVRIQEYNRDADMLWVSISEIRPYVYV